MDNKIQPKELAQDIMNYLIGNGGDFIPIDKDIHVVSTSVGEAISIDDFYERLVEEIAHEMYEHGLASYKLKGNGDITYEVFYKVKHKDKDIYIIIEQKDYVMVHRDDEGYIDTEILYREVKAVTLEINEVPYEIDLEDLRKQIYIYEPFSDAIYESFNSAKGILSNTYKSEAERYTYARKKHLYWENNKPRKFEKGGYMPTFAEFHEETRRLLKKFLEEKRSENFILDFIEERLDTAHLYGLREGEKLSR